MVANNIQKSVLALAIWIGVWADAQAQNVKIYKGEVQGRGGLNGSAEYAYKAGKHQDVVLHGSYELDLMGMDSMNVMSFYKEKWKGEYGDGLRMGNWEFTIFEHTLRVRDVQNFELSYGLSSRVSRLKGGYQKGLPAGRWEYENNQYEGSKNLYPLSRASLGFKEGVVFGDFSYNTPPERFWMSVKGSASTGGLMDGTWEWAYLLDSQYVVERRAYDQGFLLEVLQMDSSRTDTLGHVTFEDVRERLQLIRQSSGVGLVTIDTLRHGLLFDQGYAPGSVEVKIQRAGNERLQMVLDKLESMDTTLQRNSYLALGTARFRYPLTEQDKKEIGLLTFQYDSLKAIVEKVMANPLLKVNDQHTDSLAWIYQYFRQHAQHLKTMDKLMTVLTSEDFELVNEGVFLSNFEPYFPDSLQIHYQHDRKRKSQLLTFKTSHWHTMRELFDRLHEEVALMAKLDHHIDLEIRTILQSGRLDELETEILERKLFADSLLSLAYQPDQVNTILESLREGAIEDEYGRRKQAYASSTSFDEKITLGLELITFLNGLAHLPERLENVYKRHTEIEEAYTIVKFDPYTFNAELVTKRKRVLYEKVAEFLFEFLISELETETDFRNVEERLKELKSLQHRLVEFLDEDTRRLEKKIKNKKSPEAIKALINI